MTVALILLAAIIAVGLLLYAEHRSWLRRHAKDSTTEVPAAHEPADDSECCGMHITCEKDSLLAAVSKEIVYYDDEELDRFAGRGADSYSDAETEEFRDVLLTMQPDDIAGWARSLQLRNIELPQDVRDELLMIVAETRQNRNLKHVAVS